MIETENAGMVKGSGQNYQNPKKERHFLFVQRKSGERKEIKRPSHFFDRDGSKKKRKGIIPIKTATKRNKKGESENGKEQKAGGPPVRD